MKIHARLEVKGRRWKRCKQLLDDLKERRGYWKLREEAQDRTVWRTGFGIGCVPVVRQTAELMNECYRFGVTRMIFLLGSCAIRISFVGKKICEFCTDGFAHKL